MKDREVSVMSKKNQQNKTKTLLFSKNNNKN